MQVALVIESVMVIKSGRSRGALALCGLETSHGRVDTQCSKYLLWMLLQSSLLLKITKGSEKDSVLGTLLVFETKVGILPTIPIQSNFDQSAEMSERTFPHKCHQRFNLYI